MAVQSGGRQCSVPNSVTSVLTCSFASYSLSVSGGSHGVSEGRIVNILLKQIHFCKFFLAFFTDPEEFTVCDEILSESKDRRKKGFCTG